MGVSGDKPYVDSPGLTERQQKWFASVQASLERDTGKTIDEWVAIAKSCPYDKPRARVDWLRQQHGLGVNRCAHVLSVAFPDAMGWDEPDALRAALALPDTVCGQRKAFTAFSRKVQMAAARPVKGGHAMVGFAVALDADPRLKPRGNESWGDRLKSQMLLTSPDEVDASVAALLKQAWERS